MIGSPITGHDSEWYRASRWTPEAKALFFEKLRRARDKGQYAAIQGVHLMDSDDAWEWRGAIEILAPLAPTLTPETSLSLAALVLAWAFEELGDFDAAAEAYARSIDAQRDHGERNNAALYFARFVAETTRRSAFDDARAGLDLYLERLDGEHLSRGNHFADLSSRAQIAAAEGDRRNAADLAAASFEALGFTAAHWTSVPSMRRRSRRMIERTADVLASDHPIACARPT